MSTDETRFYFDITDIVQHCHAQNRVTGVQRVALNVIRRFAQKYGFDRMSCIFYDSRKNRIWECAPDFIPGTDEFDADLILFKLGLQARCPLFPVKSDLRAYLRPYAGTQYRKLKKLAIHISAFLLPWRLRNLGLQTIYKRFKGVSRVERRWFRGLQSGDALVFLGGHWRWSPIHELLRAHASGGGDVLQMIYDLVPIRWPEYCETQLVMDFGHWLNEIAPYPLRYVCISENTARDLREFLTARHYRRQCVAVPLAHEFAGASRNERPALASARLQALSRRPYMLCVGTIEIRKNGARLLRACHRLRTELGSRLPLLVFAGRHGWKTEEFDAQLAQHDELRSCVAIVDSPSDTEVAFLYAHCMFTIYPSLYEGWGLPVGEAAWFGKYCIASNAASIPEVCGELIDYVDPNSEDELVEKIRRAVLDPAYVPSREAAIAAAPLRTWDDVTEMLTRLILEKKSSEKKSEPRRQEMGTLPTSNVRPLPRSPGEGQGGGVAARRMPPP